ncbi:oligosaccharide flippase family protein [Thermococcus aggregans]|uniref:Oligosaccharide flippase family protein n=1 Tax=Thermococcus aggregans TaxID=110163 RepID=A0A9E7MYC4_THEAG|nr:oligosaccharide flippase family protein [Thermococcus aggregans]USS41090.1 oligosaccharide flippase family protein [Thermococcus aggregans]
MNLSRLLGHEFYISTFILMVAIIVSNLFNYLYQVFMGRFLTPAEYGELLALLSLLYVVSVVFDTINASSTKLSALYGNRRKLVRKGSFLVLVAGVLLYFLLLVVSVPLSGFLNIQELSYFSLVFLSVPLGMLLSFYQGILRGLQKFGNLAISISSWAVFKFAIGAVLVIKGLGVVGGILGFPLASLLTIFLTLAFIWRRTEESEFENAKSLDLRDFLRFSWFAFLAMLFYASLWNLDLILVKHYFPPAIAGQYSVISVVGRISLFSTMAVGLVVLPKATRSGKNQKMLLKALGFTLIVLGVVLALYYFIPEFILNVLYGPKYITLTPYIWKYGLAMSFLGMVNVMMNYGLATDNFKIVYCMIFGVLMEVLGIMLYHGSIGAVINVVVWATFAVFVLMLLVIWRDERA